LLWLVLLPVWACAPSVEDQVAKLGKTGEDREQAKQELLLAKDRAVGPLLEALDDPRYAASRAELAEVLASLMMRVDDDRIGPALDRHLSDDPNPRVRARLARLAGVYHRTAAIDPLLAALAGDDGEVRYQALIALGVLDEKLSEAQRQAIQERSRQLLADEHPGVRVEAQIRCEQAVRQWLDQARQLELQAQLGAAEQLYRKALDYLPTSKQALYRLGRFYLDNGQRERGLAALRQHGMLLDVPRLSAEPRVDGRLDDPVWQQAARADSFYQFSSVHKATLPSEVQTRFYLGYTADGLYLGLYARDQHPDSLVVKTRERDGQVWWEDMVELFFDTHFDHRSYAHVGINSIGTVADVWHRDGITDQDPKWNARSEVGASVGVDHWALEYKLGFGQKEVPAPAPGTLWGANVVRVFRASEYSQWVRTYGGLAHTPDDFGVLLFR
jgi:tetratricopeptide (TPR) repeat protein